MEKSNRFFLTNAAGECIFTENWVSTTIGLFRFPFFGLVFAPGPVGAVSQPHQNMKKVWNPILS